MAANQPTLKCLVSLKHWYCSSYKTSSKLEVTDVLSWHLIYCHLLVEVAAGIDPSWTL